MLWQFGILMFAAIFILSVPVPLSLDSSGIHTDEPYSVGFWHALFTLDEGNYGVWEIAKYMVNIWFGLDSTGFDISVSHHFTDVDMAVVLSNKDKFPSVPRTCHLFRICLSGEYAIHHRHGSHLINDVCGIERRCQSRGKR